MRISRAEIHGKLELLAAAVIALPAWNQDTVQFPAVGADVRLYVVELLTHHVIHARPVGILLPGGALMLRLSRHGCVGLLLEIRQFIGVLAVETRLDQLHPVVGGDGHAARPHERIDVDGERVLDNNSFVGRFVGRGSVLRSDGLGVDPLEGHELVTRLVGSRHGNVERHQNAPGLGRHFEPDAARQQIIDVEEIKEIFLQRQQETLFGRRRLQVTVEKTAPVGGVRQAHEIRLQQITDRQPRIIARLTGEGPLIIAPRLAGHVGHGRVGVPLRLGNVGKLPKKSVLQRHRTRLTLIKPDVLI